MSIRRETDIDSDPYAIRRLQSLDTSLEDFQPLVLSFLLVMDGSFVALSQVQGATPPGRPLSSNGVQ